jgi:tetratricopeptide (TPR) repeat protein
MNLAHHYRTLGLRQGASFGEVKTTYRQLVRRYHPDLNPDEQAIEQFIKINRAYKAIAHAIALTSSAAPSPLQAEKSSAFNLDSLKAQLEKIGIGSFTDLPTDLPAASADVPPSQPNRQTVSQRSKVAESPSSHGLETYRASDHASTREESLKQDAYFQLKELLKQQKFPRAIALVEGLAHRMPADSEISQWQAIVYQRWGRLLISQGQTQKARIYLKKALRTDPGNQSLWSEINRDFWQLAHLTEPHLTEPFTEPLTEQFTEQFTEQSSRVVSRH